MSDLGIVNNERDSELAERMLLADHERKEMLCAGNVGSYGYSTVPDLV